MLKSAVFPEYTHCTCIALFPTSTVQADNIRSAGLALSSWVVDMGGDVKHAQYVLSDVECDVSRSQSTL